MNPRPAFLLPPGERGGLALLQDRPPEVLQLGGPEGFPRGLAAGSHQAAGAEPGDQAAALGFAAALFARALMHKPDGRGLWVQAAEASREAGQVYAPGLGALGLDPDRIGVVAARSGGEALRAVDEALKSGAVLAVLADLGDERRLDLSVTRRFNLSAGRSGAVALLLTRDLDATSAALTRWQVAGAPSRERGRRLGRPAFHLSLVRNRFGPTGEWTLEWDSDDRVFRHPPPLPLSLARPAGDRPSPARDPGTGLPPGAYRQAG